jgi:hypothetical protein
MPLSAAGCAARERVFGASALLDKILRRLAHSSPAALACVEATCQHMRRATAPHWRAACRRHWPVSCAMRHDVPTCWRALFRQLHLAAASPPAPPPPRFDCGSYSFCASISHKGMRCVSAGLGCLLSAEGHAFRVTAVHYQDDDPLRAAEPSDDGSDDDSSSSDDEDTAEDKEWRKREASTWPLRAADVHGEAAANLTARIFVQRADGAVACLAHDVTASAQQHSSADPEDALVEAAVSFTATLPLVPGTSRRSACL